MSTTLTPEQRQAQQREAASAFVANAARPANQMPEPHYFGLHIGPPGSGKTHVLGTLPGKTLILDCRDGGNGTAPLVEHGERLDVLAITNWDDLKNAVIFLEHGEHEYQSVGIDGLSKLQGYDLRFIIQNTVRKGGERAVKMEKDMWGTALDHFVGLTNRLQMIGEARKIHIAVTVWEKAAGGDDEDSASDMIPDLQGGIKNRLAGMFDVSVYHTTRTVPDESEPENPGQTEFRCLTVPFGNRKQAKCRWKRILGDGEDQKIVQALDPIEKLDISNWIDRIRLGCKQLLEIRKVGATPPAEATPAPAPAPAPDPAPAPAPAAPTADAATVAANQAAAAELAASSEATASREDLLAICREWVNGARKKYAEKEAEIVAFVLELSASLGVEKLGQLQTVEQVQQAIDAMDKFETEQLAT